MGGSAGRREDPTEAEGGAQVGNPWVKTLAIMWLRVFIQGFKQCFSFRIKLRKQNKTKRKLSWTSLGPPMYKSPSRPTCHFLVKEKKLLASWVFPDSKEQIQAVTN